MDIFKMENIRKNLKLRHFRLIEVLAETKNIRRTADRLNITPGAVSKSCLEIENILKTKLLSENMEVWFQIKFVNVLSLQAEE